MVIYISIYIYICIDGLIKGLTKKQKGFNSPDQKDKEGCKKRVERRVIMFR